MSHPFGTIAGLPEHPPPLVPLEWEMSSCPIPRVIRLRTIARRQHGLFTLAQALDAGFGRAAVRRTLHAGTWQEIAPRVYGPGSPGD